MKLIGRLKSEQEVIDVSLDGQVAIVGSIVFFVTFVELGLIQPNYDMTRDTVSMLVLGKWGGYSQ